MPERDHVEHVPVIGRPSEQADQRFHLIFDTETGRKIGASPHVNVEQTKYTKDDDTGTITTTLKITHIKHLQR